jgi:hypothetical protein
MFGDYDYFYQYSPDPVNIKQDVDSFDGNTKIKKFIDKTIIPPPSIADKTAIIDQTIDVLKVQEIQYRFITR